MMLLFLVSLVGSGSQNPLHQAHRQGLRRARHSPQVGRAPPPSYHEAMTNPVYTSKGNTCKDLGIIYQRGLERGRQSAQGRGSGSRRGARSKRTVTNPPDATCVDWNLLTCMSPLIVVMVLS